jgi:ComF family protein
MKRSVHESLTLAMGGLLANAIRDRSGQPPAELLVPVPAHWTKRLRRGVNGPDLLVESIGRKLRIATAMDLLRSQRKTEKQGTLMPSQRFANVRNAFVASDRYDVSGLRILLVDDIMTTGATASEAAKTLRRAGVADVRVAVVARGVGVDKR